MKKLWNKWTDIALVKRILVGLILGAILGIAVPGATGIAILGDVFVSALKAIAPLLVFFLVISSLCNAGKSHGGVIKTVIILYMFSTVLAAVIAVFASMAFPVKLTLATAATTDAAAPQGIVEVLNNLLLNLVANPVSSLVNANYVGILTWAILLGLALRTANNTTKKVLADIADGISLVVSWIINLAPFGIMGLVFANVSDNGLSIFTQYGRLLLLLVGTMLLMALVINPLIIFIYLHRNPYPLVLRCLRESGLTAFFTRSSAANIPVNMSLCEKLGLDKDIYSVSIPLGATINMDGAAITITIMTLAAANTLGMEVSLPAAILLSIMSALGACGASGVAGGSLLLIPMACSLFGISNDIAMQVVGVGFIIGVIQDEIIDAPALEHFEIVFQLGFIIGGIIAEFHRLDPGFLAPVMVIVELIFFLGIPPDGVPHTHGGTIILFHLRRLRCRCCRRAVYRRGRIGGSRRCAGSSGFGDCRCAAGSDRTGSGFLRCAAGSLGGNGLTRCCGGAVGRRS